MAICLVSSSLAACSGGGGTATTAAQAAAPAAPAADGTEASGDAAMQSAASGDPIKIGVSNMVTGPMAAGGLRMKQAITLAFEEINAAGGVLGGRPLEMVLVDDTGQIAMAAPKHFFIFLML